MNWTSTAKNQGNSQSLAKVRLVLHERPYLIHLGVVAVALLVALVMVAARPHTYSLEAGLSAAVICSALSSIAIDKLARREQRKLERTMSRLEERIGKLMDDNRQLNGRNHELEQYAHTVAHNLKGSLAQVVGFSSVLAEGYGELEEAEVVDLLNTVVNAGKKMNRIVDDILLLASISRGKVVPQIVDMSTTVNEAIKRLDGLLDVQEASITLPQSWPTAVGYTPWIEEIWYNYISNAIKYGGKPAQIELGGHELSNGKMVFWIKDNGPGISRKFQGAIFDEFERVAPRHVEGHGLGLPIVKQIAEKLGGEAGVESRIGLGSTFYFTLPAVRTEPAHGRG